MKSYLENRKQFTLINGKKSNIDDIRYGVPQGSILGPLLFLLFVNDISKAFNRCEGKLFADDTALLLFNRDIHVLVNNAEQALSSVDKWFKLNKLSISAGKSTFLLFHSIKKDGQAMIDRLKLGEEYIPRSKHVKYIGLQIDECLTWDHHIKELCASLCKYFSIFYNIRNCINPSLARIIYYTCIHSRIKYGIEVYGSAKQNRIQKIQVMQNKLMKLLLKRDYTYSTNQLHKDLNILKVSDVHRHATLQFVYKCVSGKIIPNFRKYFIDRTNIHDHDTRHIRHIYKPIPNIDAGETTTHYIGATLWNDLTEYIKSAKSIHVFKKRVFNSLINVYNE